MRKIMATMLAGILALSMVACGGSSSSSAAASEPAASTPASSAAETSSSEATGTELSGSVSTNGSTSMENVIGILSEQFMADNAGVTVTYDPTGSGTGIDAALNGTTDIGLSSRALTDEETANGLVGTNVALDGIAIIVNAENPITDLSLEQIASIYTGEVTDWADVQ